MISEGASFGSLPKVPMCDVIRYDTVGESATSEGHFSLLDSVCERPAAERARRMEPA